MKSAAPISTNQKTAPQPKGNIVSFTQEQLMQWAYSVPTERRAPEDLYLNLPDILQTIIAVGLEQPTRENIGEVGPMLRALALLLKNVELSLAGILESAEPVLRAVG
jgi:hypothetical protein